MAIKVGTKFKLKSDFGNQAYDPIGGMKHGLASGSVGAFQEFVSADIKGAHNDQEDAYVLEFEDTSLSVGPDGKMVSTPVSRRVAFSVTDFSGPDALFEEV